MAKKPAAPPEPTPSAIATIRVVGPERGRWRGRFGTPRHFTPEPQDFPVDALTEEEVAEILEDGELNVVFLDAEGALVNQDGLAPAEPAPAN